MTPYERQRAMVKLHQDYHDEVDRIVDSGVDYFGRPIDISKSTAPGFVYHLYSGDALLYVGKTTTPLQRILTGARNHRKYKEWFHEVERIELFRFHRESQALSAEAFDIQRLNPVHNIVRPSAPNRRPTPTHKMEYEPHDEAGLANAFYFMTPYSEGEV